VPCVQSRTIKGTTEIDDIASDATEIDSQVRARRSHQNFDRIGEIETEETAIVRKRNPALQGDATLRTTWRK
jgi:hypothetical protein